MFGSDDNQTDPRLSRRKIIAAASGLGLASVTLPGTAAADDERKLVEDSDDLNVRVLDEGAQTFVYHGPQKNARAPKEIPSDLEEYVLGCFDVPFFGEQCLSVTINPAQGGVEVIVELAGFVLTSFVLDPTDLDGCISFDPDTGLLDPISGELCAEAEFSWTEISVTISGELCDGGDCQTFEETLTIPLLGLDEELDTVAPA